MSVKTSITRLSIVAYMSCNLKMDFKQDRHDGAELIQNLQLIEQSEFFLTKKGNYANHCILSVMTSGGIQFIMRYV